MAAIASVVDVVSTLMSVAYQELHRRPALHLTAAFVVLGGVCAILAQPVIAGINRW